MQRYLARTALSLALALAMLRGAVAQNAAAPASDPNGAAKPEDALPPGFEAPRPVPPVMTLDKPLMPEAQLDELEKAFKLRLISTLRGPDNAANRQALKDWAQVRLYRLTLPKHRNVPQQPLKAKAVAAVGQKKADPPEQVSELVSKLQREIDLVGSNIDNQSQSTAYRRFALSEITGRAAELLDNHFHVRLNAVILLSKLNLVDGDSKRGVKERAFVPAMVPLLEVLKAPTSGEVNGQKEAVKLKAAEGLGRIALLADPGELTIVMRNDIAQALVDQLADKNAFYWYQMRLVEALGKVDLVTDKNGEQFILRALGDVLTDTTRDLVVRAEAAKALGRAQLPGNVNWDTLVYRVVSLGKELVDAYQKNPADYLLIDAFYKLYFAFRPETPKEVADFAGRAGGGPGLIFKQNAPAIVQTGYQQILPFVQHVYKQPLPNGLVRPAKFADQAVADLTAWLQKNPPTNNKLSPVLPDLNPGGPLKAAAAGGE